MSQVRLVLTTFGGNYALQELQNLETVYPDGDFVALVQEASTTKTIDLPRSAYERLRPMLRKLAATRVPALDADGLPLASGHTTPLLTYSIEPLPVGRPSLDLISGDVVPSADAVLSVAGSGLIAGTKASAVHYVEVAGANLGPAGRVQRYATPVAAFSLTAVAKGPGGNNIRYRILPAAAADDVTITADPDGLISITITPQTGSETAADIVAQLAAASAWVTAVSLSGTTHVGPTDTPQYRFGAGLAGVSGWVYLTGGDGAGLARCDLMVAGTDPANRLQLVAQKPGSPSNAISFILKISQLSNSVTVTAKQIEVHRTAATVAIGTLASAINADADAAALVKATAVGSGSLGAIAETWLYHGADEEVSATVGGAPAVVTDYSDTGCTLTVLGADLDTAGVAGDDALNVTLAMGLQKFTATRTTAGTVTLSGDITFTADANHTITASATSGTETPGIDIVVQGGPGSPTGDSNGGALYLRGGPRANGGIDGNLVLGDADTTQIVLGDTAVPTQIQGPLGLAGILSLGADVQVDVGADTTPGVAGQVDKIAGTFVLASGGSTYTLTNSYITATSLIFAMCVGGAVGQSIRSFVPGAGSAVLSLSGNAGANSTFAFLVINPIV